MGMNCNDARAGLWPPEQPRLVGEEVAEARLHVEGCAECTEYFEQDRGLLDLYDRVREQRAPRQVRERVFDALSQARWAAAGAAQERAGRGIWLRRAAWPAAVAAALVVVLFVELRPAGPPPADETAMFVEDYLRRAVGQDHIETDDPTEVRRFLQRELGMQLQPLRLAGLTIARAEICLLEGRRGAMIVYKKDGAEVSHYLVPRDGAERRSPRVSAYAGGTSEIDMPVVTWSTPRVEQALVGEFDSDQLLEIARLGSSDE